MEIEKRFLSEAFCVHLWATTVGKLSASALLFSRCISSMQQRRMTPAPKPQGDLGGIKACPSNLSEAVIKHTLLRHLRAAGVGTRVIVCCKKKRRKKKEKIQTWATVRWAVCLCSITRTSPLCDLHSAASDVITCAREDLPWNRRSHFFRLTRSRKIKTCFLRQSMFTR